jgi:hypothetical protein
LVFAVAGADRQVAQPAPALVGAALVLTTEAGQILHGAASWNSAANRVDSSR